MARCELRIALDDDRSTYRPGETVMGELTVETDGPVRVDDLTVELGYKLTGAWERIVAEQTLFSGDLAGGERCFPIRLNCPSGPHTHDSERVEFRGSVRTPETAPRSFQQGPVAITWRVECVVERAGRPYWSASRVLRLRG